MQSGGGTTLLGDRDHADFVAAYCCWVKMLVTVERVREVLDELLAAPIVPGSAGGQASGHFLNRRSQRGPGATLGAQGGGILQSRRGSWIRNHPAVHWRGAAHSRCGGCT